MAPSGQGMRAPPRICPPVGLHGRLAHGAADFREEAPAADSRSWLQETWKLTQSLVLFPSNRAFVLVVVGGEHSSQGEAESSASSLLIRRLQRRYDEKTLRSPQQHPSLSSQCPERSLLNWKRFRGEQSRQCLWQHIPGSRTRHLLNLIG